MEEANDRDELLNALKQARSTLVVCQACYEGDYQAEQYISKAGGKDWPITFLLTQY